MLTTKEYCDQNETLTTFFVNESRARGTARGRLCGLLSIPRQGFNRLIQSSINV